MKTGDWQSLHNCNRKQPYESWKEARVARRSEQKRIGIKLHVYRCRHCLQLHLTKQRREDFS